MPTPKTSAVKAAATKAAVKAKVARNKPASKRAPAEDLTPDDPQWKPPKMSKRTEEEALAVRRRDERGEYIMAPNGMYKLYLTEVPGEYLSEVGSRVDHRNFAISVLSLGRKIAEDRERKILGGRLAETPAEVLKVAALDRDMPLAFRIDAAAKAAPYFDRKMPQAVDGGADPANPGGPGLPIDVNLKGLSGEELATLKALFLKAQKAQT